jgi:hypothetical protein
MESYTVAQKDSESVFYVLSMAKTMQEVVVLANCETGELLAISLTTFVSKFEFNAILEDEFEDDADDLDDVDEG